MSRGVGTPNWDNPQHIQASIVKRFMGDAAFDDFMQQYKAARKMHPGMMYPISDNDRAIASEVKKYGYAEASRRLGVSYSKVEAVVRRVSKHAYLTN